MERQYHKFVDPAEEEIKMLNRRIAALEHTVLQLIERANDEDLPTIRKADVRFR